jgi:hypothetical protein
VASPDTFVEIGSDRRAVHAVTAGAEERARLWPKLVELRADFDNYQSWTDREIPVVVLKPRWGCGGLKPGFDNAVATPLPIGPC